MKTHLHFGTQDLDDSVAFYRTLLNAEPTKHYEGYALFVTERPGLELALSVDARARLSASTHFGIAVDSPELVGAAIERLRRAGRSVDVETAQTCCYATQNKVWAADPDGRRWETYFVIAETEERDGENIDCCSNHDEASACCTSRRSKSA
jgi:catechol 2,3-dioxygenase-like lactoylglutathione lyase family enzyme